MRAEAARLGLAVEPVRLADSTRTAEQAAAACGCGIDQIVKSIVFRVAGSDACVLFLTAGGNRVDPAKATTLAGRPLEKADAAAVRAHTGFAIGGVAPIGHLTPVAAEHVSARSCGSSQASIGVRCPIGATPPMAKPVWARTPAASAFSSGRPASAAALAGSTRLPPAVRNRTRRRSPRRGRRST